MANPRGRPTSNVRPKTLPSPWRLSKRTWPRNGKLVLPNDGVIALIDKDSGWTSFDVVAKSRSIFRVKKIGHAGTLDPMATGLLILCVGRATKLVETFMGQGKAYQATVTLGTSTESYDAETDVVETRDVPPLSQTELQQFTQSLTGSIAQVPPMYSARKIEGKRLYKLARKGLTVEREAKNVLVSRFDITSIDFPRFDAEIDCSKGTYIRSLAHDMGQLIGCGAHLSALRRTRIGEFDVDDALTIDELTRLEVFHPGDILEPQWD